MTSHRIIKNLKRSGNTVLGVGCYSAVLSSKSGEEAIKVGTNLDDPWLDFYSLAIQEDPTNPHFPEIKNFYQDENHEFYICTLEQLHEISPTHEDLITLVKKYTEGFLSDDEFLQEARKYSKHVPYPQQLMNAVKIIKTYTTHYKFEEGFDVTYDSVECDRCLDMHRGNFMFRDELLVITDPWCNYEMSDVEDLSGWAEDNLL